MVSKQELKEQWRRKWVDGPRYEVTIFHFLAKPYTLSHKDDLLYTVVLYVRVHSRGGGSSQLLGGHN